VDHFVAELLDQFARNFHSIGDELYFGGNFTKFNTDTIVGVAKWNGLDMSTLGCGIQWNCTTPGISGSINPVYSIIRFGNNIFVTGSFDQAGNKTVNGLTMWDGNSWNNFGTGLKTWGGYWGTGLGFKVIDNELYVFGVFDSINGNACNSLAKFNGTTWVSVYNFPIFSSMIGYHNQVYDIAKYNDQLYVCGNFDNYPLMTISYITKWDGNNWVNVGNGINGGIIDARRMVVYKDELVVAGRFSKTINPTNPGENIGKWDGTQWTELGSGVDEIIWDMKVHNDTLYVCGAFQHAGGIPANKLARWDGSKWCGYGITINNVIVALDFYHDTLYIGGGFNYLNSDSIWGVAKWTGGNYVDTCSSTIGIEQIENQQQLISIYPNPATNAIYILGITTNAIAEVYDISGKLILTRKLLIPQLDISALAQGMYFIKLCTKEGSVVRKFVKE